MSRVVHLYLHQLLGLPLYVMHHPSRFTPLTDGFVGHGTVLFVIISIETSIGIVCGCLPGCKPLFTKLFPSIFAHSTSSNSYLRSRSKKPQYPTNKSADGRAFPFQIVKEEGFEVRYGDEDGLWNPGTSRKLGTNSSARAEVSKSIGEESDNVPSEDGREWISMQKNPGSKVTSV